MLQNINDNNKNIHAYNLAVGEKSGEVYLTDLSADDCNHISKENINNNADVSLMGGVKPQVGLNVWLLQSITIWL